MAKDDIGKAILIYLNEMDFVSQKKTERYFKIIILTVAVISFIVSYFQQRFSTCVYSVLLACAFCIILFVPGYPFWKKNELQWQPDAKKAV
ncbi:hypothetical protein ABPG74_017856 [Tetrahymena malaccensis]